MNQEFHQPVKFWEVKSIIKSCFLSNIRVVNMGGRGQSTEFKDGPTNLYRKILFTIYLVPCSSKSLPPPILFYLNRISYIYMFLYSKLEMKYIEEREQNTCNWKTAFKNACKAIGNLYLLFRRLGGHDSEICLCTALRGILHSGSKTCRTCYSDLSRESWVQDSHHWSADAVSWVSRESTWLTIVTLTSSTYVPLTFQEHYQSLMVSMTPSPWIQHCDKKFHSVSL